MNLQRSHVALLARSSQSPPTPPRFSGCRLEAVESARTRRRLAGRASELGNGGNEGGRRAEDKHATRLNEEGVMSADGDKLGQNTTGLNIMMDYVLF